MHDEFWHISVNLFRKLFNVILGQIWKKSCFSEMHTCVMKSWCTVHPNIHAYDLCPVVLCCGYVLAAFTHIIQGYFTGIIAIKRLPN